MHVQLEHPPGAGDHCVGIPRSPFPLDLPFVFDEVVEQIRVNKCELFLTEIYFSWAAQAFVSFFLAITTVCFTPVPAP